MVSANYVAVSVLSPFLGRLGDIFGRRNILIAGNSFAAIGCVISATAQSVNAVIGGVVLIGIGSAGHQVAWGCIGEVVPRNYRPIAIAAFESSVTPASVAGALIGMFSDFLKINMESVDEEKHTHWLTTQRVGGYTGFVSF
jgi:MFS family permease